MNLASPSEFEGPGRWRTNSRPRATAAMFSSVTGNDGAVISPLAAAADSRAPQPTSDVAPPPDEEKASRENRYVHGMIGRRLGHGFSLSSSASWWRLNMVDGVELYYPANDRVRQHGEASDVRIGVLKEFRPGHSIEAVALHNRFAMNQDVASTETLWDPTLRQFTSRARIEPNADETDTWGLHLSYLRPLADSTWHIGAILTANRINQPRLPAYDIPEVPADASRAQAYNIGAGISRSTSQLVAGFEAIYEPIWRHSWVRADEPTEARDGTPIDAGANVLENDFRFHNAIARLGLGFAVPIGDWLRASLREMLRGMLGGAGSFAAEHLDSAAVTRLVEEHDTGARDHSQRLYSLLMLELWWRARM